MSYVEVEIINPQDSAPSDTEILSAWRLLFSPQQLAWNPDDSQELAEWDDQRILDYFRNNLLMRTNQFAFWAVFEGEVVGYASLYIPSEPSRKHCGELGFGVHSLCQHRGIGYRLLQMTEERAEKRSICRIECSCFSENTAAIALLRKAGYATEGYKRSSIQHHGRYVDQVLFAKLIG